MFVGDDVGDVGFAGHGSDVSARVPISASSDASLSYIHATLYYDIFLTFCFTYLDIFVD